ncbi:hypothetical protein ACQP1O_13450 [Nocardia sp. CA-151230]|uniref:hypothetical protein n=1 Tax=Nocardia sp. CA-151230 TaxID=3239982 RepID=UPI003D8D2A35
MEQRLYLPHRTVSTHLHRIFPKLGVSSRGDLAALLPAEDERRRRPGRGFGSADIDYVIRRSRPLPHGS